MGRKYSLGACLTIIGLVFMVYSPSIAEEWTDYMKYQGDGTFYYYDYLSRSIVITLIGFSIQLTGILVILFSYFSRRFRR
ncbi:hypothetical protein BIV60_24400 [Bacillus sp. MUM 116]|uniref:hypothetical protein n=1 Tax=Bacillus sp. MUM 116 TaxID=1678002 RepID=UPI0008F5AF0A|nr:hypothetical protein [Bacillus sp. MUM 116]OIK09283.1 hypothetical protein BIV60_24400 [Bacillus sp. MUM 116]